MPHKAIQNPDSTFTIQRVEVFKLGVDERTKKFNTAWFDDVALKTFNTQRAEGFLPVVHIGHTAAKGDNTERPRVAYLDNLCRDGNTVYADFAKIPQAAFSVLKDESFPHRSVEVTKDRFKSVALLSSSDPHFKLPVLDVAQFKADEADGDIETITFDGEATMSLDQIVAQGDIQKKKWDLEDAFWKKLWAIKDDDQMTPEAKKAAIDSAYAEYAPKAAELDKQLVDATPAAVSSASASDGPESITAAAAPDPELEKFKSELDKTRKDLAATKLTAFTDKLKTMGLAIPIIDRFSAMRTALEGNDTVVRFAANGTAEESFAPDALEKFMLAVADLAGKNTLIAFRSETPKPFKHEQPDTVRATETGTPKVNAEADAEIKAFATQEKISYNEAYARLAAEHKVQII
jgi:hypothetical protein